MLWTTIFVILLLSDIIGISGADIKTILEYNNIDNNLCNFVYTSCIKFSVIGFNFLEIINGLWSDIDTYFIYNNKSFIYGLKFCFSLLFLIFIRAGIPRYRYDFLTKIGWIKFFLYSLFLFSFNYIIFVLI